MSLERLTYIKTLFEAILFLVLVPLILWEVFCRPGESAKRALGGKALS